MSSDLNARIIALQDSALVRLPQADNSLSAP